jgi:hypothetical protein
LTIASTVRKAAELNEPLYKKRAAVIDKIPHFWALVFEQSPPEVDNYILPSDSKVFADCLQTVEVSRIELNDPKGSPRSFSIKFGFSENEYFEDAVLEKKFWYRKSLDNWQGLVSDPFKINWKEGKDLTGGLTDAAFKLYEARKNAAGSSNGDAKAEETNLPEYKSLAAMIEQSEDPSLSFFAWFGFVSSYKWVSAEESEEASKKEAEKLEKQKRGEKVDDEEDDDENEQDFQETEVFPTGDQLATIIAEDMWPSAIKYYSKFHAPSSRTIDLTNPQRWHTRPTTRNCLIWRSST